MEVVLRCGIDMARFQSVWNRFENAAWRCPRCLWGGMKTDDIGWFKKDEISRNLPTSKMYVYRMQVEYYAALFPRLSKAETNLSATVDFC